MAKKGQQKDESVSQLPVFYADSIIKMAAGGFTSRIVLAVQNETEDTQKGVGVLVMPTQAMFAVALHILATLSGPENAKAVKGMHERFSDLIADPQSALQEYARNLRHPDEES